MKRLIAILSIMLFIIGCATPQQQMRATQGVTLETGKTRAEVMEVLVSILTEEGFAIDNINEKYGIISTKPMIILSGLLMKKLGEPGGGFVATNSHLIHTIDFFANITDVGGVTIKVTASTVENENIFSTILQNPNSRRSEAIDIQRTNKLLDYFVNKLKERLRI